MGFNGPVVGKILHAALMEVLEHPEKNRIDELLAFARQYAESESGSGPCGETDSADDPGNEKSGADDPGNEKDVPDADASHAASPGKGEDIQPEECSGDKKNASRAASPDKGKDTSAVHSRRSGNAASSGKSSGGKRAGSRTGSGSAAGKPRKGGK